MHSHPHNNTMYRVFYEANWKNIIQPVTKVKKFSEKLNFKIYIINTKIIKPIIDVFSINKFSL